MGISFIIEVKISCSLNGHIGPSIYVDYWTYDGYYITRM